MHQATLGLILATALGALACSAPGTGNQPPAQPGDAAPVYGGMLTLTRPSDPLDWDMRNQGKSNDNTAIHGFVYNSLLGFKDTPGTDPNEFILRPELAETWDISPDARSLTFHLRQGVKFSDTPPVNGREFTSADVKWSWEYYSSTGEFKDTKLPPSQMLFMYEGLERVETPDKYTAVARFKDPFVPFLNYSASQWMPMAAKEVFAQDGNLGKTLVGTGPYVLDVPGSQMGAVWMVKKNRGYWEPGKPYLDAIRTLILPEIATVHAAFQTKQLDVVLEAVDAQAQDTMRANADAVMAQSLKSQARGFLLSQLRPGPLQDVRVRRALSLAIDRDEVNKIVNGGKGEWATSGLWPGLFTEAEVKQMVKFDPEEAKRLLAEANYPKDLVLKNMLLNTGDNSLTLLVQAQWKKVGVTMDLEVLTREVHRPRLYKGDFDVFTLGSSGVFEADADSQAMALYSGSSLNWSIIKDPELDKLLIGQRQERDPQKRRDILRAAMKRVNDQAWGIGFVFQTEWQVWHSYVKGYQPHNSSGEHQAMVWLQK